ncbi:MAG: HD domain-containing protein [Gemmatimonadales bacterium]|jgi:metal-dependent HD superfamily phosphatase/phosphodiesterase
MKGAEGGGGGREPGGPGRTVKERFANRIEMVLPARQNKKLGRLVEQVNADDELYALWVAENVTAIDRLNMTDHGPVHVKIVTNLAVRMLRLLMDHGVEPSVVKDYGMSREDAEVVVALAALFHDVGMSIQRSDHESFSLFVAQSKLKTMLEALYPVAEATILRSEVLHAIIAHRSGGKPLTLEAGIVRIADALDIAKGRSRIPFEAGGMSIHSVSAAAIEAVRLEPGEKKAVRVVIEMSNSAGVFQLDELFRKKLAGSGLEPHVELEAQVVGEEKKLIERYAL